MMNVDRGKSKVEGRKPAGIVLRVIVPDSAVRVLPPWLRLCCFRTWAFALGL